MRWTTILIVVGCTVLVGCRVSPTQIAGSPTVIATIVGPAAGDRLRTLYQDDEMRIVAVDYGPRGSPQTPGFYVFGKHAAKWIRIEKVALKNAVLGCSPTVEECRAAGKNPPSIGWDFRPLAGREYVDFPLTFGGFLFFPDKIEKDEASRRLILRFNSAWQMPLVETVLSVALDDLRPLLAPG